MATSLIGGKGFSGSRTGQTGNHMTGYGQIGGNVIPKGYQVGQLQQMQPWQMDIIDQLRGQISPESQLGRLAAGDQSQFEQMEAPALRQLGQLQGGLASRFSGMGLGARNSSGFQQAQGGLAADFAERLAGNRMNLQRQAQQDLFGLSRDLLGQRPTEQILTPEQMPWWKELLSSLASGIGTGIGSLPMALSGLSQMRQNSGMRL